MQIDQTVTLTQLEQINRIILDLYEDSQPFHTGVMNFFQSVMEIVFFDKASLLFFYQDESGIYRKRNSITLNWDAALLDAYDRNLYQLDDTLAPVDKPYHILLRSSAFFDEDRRSKSHFFMEYQRPSNADYEIFGNVLIQDDSSLRCKICFARCRESTDFSIADMRIIRLFQPHLSRIISTHLRHSESPTGFENLKNYNCIGFCVLDENCRLVKTNDVFQALNTRVHNKLLNKILELCNNFRSRDNHSPRMLSCEYKLDDAPLFLEIICTSERNAALQYDCMVYDLSHFFTSTLAQIRNTYHLTDREYEIFTYILQGLRNEEIAQRLFLSVPSIKKYVSSIFDKLGITNQKQIFSKLNFF